ncbi:vicilin-like antimicrobial peptides 2-2 [Papaver somniferum]|nr:vicilin-like antimicrobial peptides 2-2 [Papaver somniferum]
MAPFYNSKSSRFVMIVKGQGYFEMVCPHLSETQQRGQRTQAQEETEQEGVHYQRISAQLRPKTAFIIPAGHPTTIVASKNENLQMVVFGINVRDNQKNFLAGRENVMNQMSREAKELGFNVQAKEVEEIFNNQKESFFLPGPQQQQQKHDVPLNSIYDFAAV